MSTFLKDPTVTTKLYASEAARPTAWSGAIDWNDPNCYVSNYFTVGEVSRNDPRRIPGPGSEEEIQIRMLAIELDRVREAWGSAMHWS